MSELEPQEELQSRLASALSLAQRNGFNLRGQALAVLEAHAEWLESKGLVVASQERLDELMEVEYGTGR